MVTVTTDFSTIKIRIPIDIILTHHPSLLVYWFTKIQLLRLFGSDDMQTAAILKL